MGVRDPNFFDLSQFSPEELLAMMEEDRAELEEANRVAAPLWAAQMLEADLDAAGVLDLAAGDELILEPDGDHFVASVQRGENVGVEGRSGFPFASRRQTAVDALRGHVNDVASGSAAWAIGLGSTDLSLLAFSLPTITTTLAMAPVADSGVPFTASSQSETRWAAQEDYILAITWSPDFIAVRWECRQDSTPPELALILDSESDVPLALAAVEPVPNGSVRFLRETLGFDPTERPWRVAILHLL